MTPQRIAEPPGVPIAEVEAAVTLEEKSKVERR